MSNHDDYMTIEEATAIVEYMVMGDGEDSTYIEYVDEDGVTLLAYHCPYLSVSIIFDARARKLMVTRLMESLRNQDEIAVFFTFDDEDIRFEWLLNAYTDASGMEFMQDSAESHGSLERDEAFIRFVAKVSQLGDLAKMTYLVR